MGITFSDPDVDTDENTVQLAALTPTDNAVIIGNGSAWVAESGATLKTSLGLTIGTDVQAYNANLTSWASVTRASGFDTFAATPSSANLAAAITDETGSSKLVFSAGTLDVASGKTLTASNTVTFTATDGSTLAIGAGGTLASAAYKATGTSGNTVPLLDGANTWSGTQTFSGAIQATFSAATPRTDYYETDGGSNGKLWSWIADTGVYYLQTRTDADVFGAAPIAITRSGTTVSSIALSATALSLSGVTSVTGAAIASPTLSGTVAGSPTATGAWLFSGGAGSAIGLANGNYIRWGQASATGDYYLGKPDSTTLNLQDNATIILSISGGGFVFGSPTGGNKGSGTINAQAVYDDNTLLTDLVLDMAVEGRFDEVAYVNHPIAKEVEDWWFDADRYAQFWKVNRHLPGMVQFTPNTRPSTGESITRLTAVVETQAALIESLNQRLKALEG